MVTITKEQLEKDSRAFAVRFEKDKKNFSYIVGISRGGLEPARIMAEELGIPFVDSEKLSSFNLQKLPLFIRGKKILVVDDLLDSGKTLKDFSDKLSSHNIRTAVLYVKDNEKCLLKPDHFFKRVPRQWMCLPHEMGLGIEDHITRLLEFIGEDPTREGLKDTPKRVAKMYTEIFRGYDPEQKPKITTFPNGKDGITYNQMILDEGSFYSHCEHHMVPFFGKYFFAYIPNKTIIGLSKVARIVDYYSARLQVQERLVKQIVDDIEKSCKPQGIALIMKAEHLCKTMRGVKKQGVMTASEMRGSFAKDGKVRQEFLSLIKL